MATKLFVGSLSYNTTDDSLQAFFAAVGTVVSAKVIVDRDTNRSKGFGFIEMQDGGKAITDHNGKEFNGRMLTVNEARPMVSRDSATGFNIVTLPSTSAVITPSPMLARVTSNHLRCCLVWRVSV